MKILCLPKHLKHVLPFFFAIAGLGFGGQTPPDITGYVLQDINRANFPPDAPWHNRTTLWKWVDQQGEPHSFYPNLDPVTLARKLISATPDQPVAFLRGSTEIQEMIRTHQPLPLQNFVPIPTGIHPDEAEPFWQSVVKDTQKLNTWLDRFETGQAWGFWIWLQFQKLASTKAQASDDPAKAIMAIETSHLQSWPLPVQNIWWRYKAWFYQNQKQFEASDQAFNQCLTLERRLGDEPLIMADLYYQLGFNAWYMADYNSGLEHFQQCHRLQKPKLEGDGRLSKTDNALGMIAVRIDQMSLAETHLRAALAIREGWGVETLLLVKTLNNLGIVAAKQGKMTEADTYFRRCLAIRELQVPGSWKVGTILNNLGLIAVVREDWQSAVAYFRESLTQKKTRGIPPSNLALGYLNLGKSLLESGETSEAMTSIHTAIDILKDNLQGSLDEGRGHLLLGRAYYRLGAYAEAMKALDDAAGILEETNPTGLDLAAAKHVKAQTLFRLGRYREALPMAQEAQRTFENIVPESRHTGEAKLLLGDLAAASKNFDEAIQHWRKGLAIQEAQFKILGGSFQTGANFLDTFTPYYHRAIEALVDKGRTAEAFLLSEHYHSQAYLLDQAKLNAGKRLPETEKLQHQLRQLDQKIEKAHATATKLDPASPDKERAWADLRKLRETRVQLKQSLLEKVLPDQPLDHKAIAENLEPGTLLISFIATENELIAFSLDGQGRLRDFQTPVPRTKLKSMVEDFRRFISRPTATGTALYRDEAKALFTTLFEPMLPTLAETDRLMIISDGPLLQLPFGALITANQPENTTYLIDRWAYNLLPSGTFLRSRKQRKRESDLELLMVGAPQHFPSSLIRRLDKTHLGEGLALFQALSSTRGPAAIPAEYAFKTNYNAEMNGAGLIEFPSDCTRSVTATEQYAPLPFSHVELDAIAEFFPAEKHLVFSGKDATKANVRAQLARARLLHFSCHSQLNSRAPFLSALVLTQKRPNEDPERLFAWEIRDSGPLNAEMAVLSACETALGPEMGGNGLLSLNQAFHLAGVPSVLASLWRVSDLSTAILMTHFYRNLTEGMGKSQALRQAQLALRSQAGSRDKDLSHPFWWAGFQLYGKPN